MRKEQDFNKAIKDKLVIYRLISNLFAIIAKSNSIIISRLVLSKDIKNIYEIIMQSYKFYAKVCKAIVYGIINNPKASNALSEIWKKAKAY